VPTSYDEEERIYHTGYRDGYAAAVRSYEEMAGSRWGGGKPSPPSKKTPRKPRKKDPKMSRALKEANAKGRTSKGALRKGWDQGRIMRLAHKLKKGM
jgi:hypothetical protein